MIFALSNSSNATILIYLLIVFVAITISLVLHEYAHGYVALLNGDPTAKFQGRLTLNPLKHFSLPGFLMLFFVGFGFAKPVPVNPRNYKHQTRGIFTVAIAGVSANLILALISWLFYYLCTFGYNILFVFYLSEFFRYMMQLNLVLIFLNLLPIYPLDGFRVVEAFTHYNNKYVRFMVQNGMMIILTLVVLSFVSSLMLRYGGFALYWAEYVDILGMYLRYTGGALSDLMVRVCWLV